MPRPLPLVVAAGLALGACGGGTPGASGHRSTTTSTSAPSGTAPLVAGAQWTTYGGSAARTADDTTDPPLTSAPASAWVSPSLDGAVYGQPLVYGGDVLVATENNTVYALSATDGTVRWSIHLAAPVPAGQLPCGDIEPTVGVTSTMVVDPATHLLYVSAASWSGVAVTHLLFAVDLATHMVRWSRGLDQPGWTAAAELQRAALALDGPDVLVGFGGNYGDCGTYNGWLVGVPAGGAGPLLAYEVPAAREGAIWAPAGPSVDDAGDVFVATGNGSARPGQSFDHGDAVIELSPQLVELSWFAPINWAEDNATDADLGSTSPMLLGGGLAFEIGKDGTAYLLRTAHLGGVGGQAAALPLCPSLGADAYAGPDAYVVCNGRGQLRSVLVAAQGTVTPGFTWSSPTGGAGSPTVARGVVWTIDGPAGVLYGVDPSTGATRYRLPLHVGSVPHFAAPSAAGDLVLVAGSSAVQAFR